MFELFFSTRGRLKRMQYFLLCLSQAVIFLPFIMALNGLGKDSFSIFPSTIPAYFVSGIGIWVLYCLSLKRSRDFSGDVLYGQAYVACFVLPSLLMLFPDTKTIGTGLLALSSIPMLWIGWKMGFAASKQNGLDAAKSETRVENSARDKENDIGEDSNAGDLTDIDLVARAAELRDAEQPYVSNKAQQPQQKQRTNTDFGRRTGGPALGNR